MTITEPDAGVLVLGLDGDIDTELHALAHPGRRMVEIKLGRGFADDDVAVVVDGAGALAARQRRPTGRWASSTSCG